MERMQIQTVLGKILPQQLGRTLTHEHFLLDFNDFHVSAPVHLQPLIDNGINLENVGLIRQYPYSSQLNITFNDTATEAAVMHDVHFYRRWGGGAIVENTTHGLKGNRHFARKIARETGIHVIQGTGHYLEMVQPLSGVLRMTVEEMVHLYMNDIVVGVPSELKNDNNNIKCGVIGEVGSTWPITDFEKRSIQATAFVQQQLKCACSFHPGRHVDAPFEIVRIYLEAGGDPNKCVMSHLDRTILDVDILLEFAKLGTYLQFDLFGTECSYYQLNPSNHMPSDAQRIDKIIRLVQEGYVNKILMSHDVHTKHRLLQFGGHGYGHIINNVLPRLLDRGLSKEQIDEITIQNPANWLQFPA